MSSLLEPPSKNPHATLVTLFMNAASDMYGGDQMPFEDQAKVAVKYEMIRDQVRRNHDVGLEFVGVALPLGRDAEKYFAK